MTTNAEIVVALTGDLVLDEPDARHWLSGIAPALHGADLVIGHLEVPHTSSTFAATGDVPAPGAPLENIAEIAFAGFDMVSLAGNHIADCGAQGIMDTRDELGRCNIASCGAGADLAEARRPAVVNAAGLRVALLSYNCVGPEFGWASEGTPGCAYLPFDTADGGPVTPLSQLGNATPLARTMLERDIVAAHEQADFVLVALHKGVVHTPIYVAEYEREIAHMAIDCGADGVIGHHAHIVRGIEFYNDRPILHGMGNGCVVTSALAPDQDNDARREWARKRRELFGFEPDPEYHLAPFHPEAINGFIGKFHLAKGQTPRVSVVPVHVEAPGRPVLAQGERADEILDYITRITSLAGLPPIQIRRGDNSVVPA